MEMLTVQVILLLAAIFVVGCILGCWLKSIFTRQEYGVSLPVPKSDLEAAAPAASAGAKSSLPGSKPAGLKKPRDGKADNLSAISGIDTVTEGQLFGAGIFHLDQIAALSGDEVTWLEAFMKSPGRIGKEDWVGQAKKLAAGGAATSTAAPAQTDLPGKRPSGLDLPRGGKPDKLTRISGIDGKAAGRLYGAGIYHIDQIAALTGEEVTWLDAFLGTAGRVAGEDWVGQAKTLASGGGSAASAGGRPQALKKPRDGKADDLKRIKGIDAVTEGQLYGAGIFHVDQIAALGEAEVKWLEGFLKSKGRIGKEDWVAQANKLTGGSSASSASAPAASSSSSGGFSRGLDVPRGGKADNLTLINGIDAKTAGRLYGLGIFHHDQIALLSSDEAKWLEGVLNADGRISKEDWAGQAKALATGGATAASRKSGGRPEGLKKPRDGKADDLKRINGIDPVTEGQLYGAGIFHVDQIAKLSEAEVAWLEGFLKAKGRIGKEDWIGQAKSLSGGA